jgi:hypothetical protein
LDYGKADRQIVARLRKQAAMLAAAVATGGMAAGEPFTKPVV